MLRIEDKDGIVIVRMEHGKVNAIDRELLESVRSTLAEIEASDARGAVLTGRGGAFSAGVDLFRVLDGGAEYLSEFLPVLSDALRELAEFPKPLVAAMNGHAIAGGCILACACDYRVLAEGSGKIGVPELLVGVPFPAVPLEIVRAVVPSRHLQEVLLLGKLYQGADALDRGLADEIVPLDQVEDRALAIACSMAGVGAGTFALSKRQVRQPMLDRMERTADRFENEVEAIWKSGSAAERIRAYLDATVGGK